MYVSDLKPGDQFTLTAHFTVTDDTQDEDYEIRVRSDDGKQSVGARFDAAIAIGGGQVLPSLSRDLTDEQNYQRDAARTMVTAANDLRTAADRIHHLASLLADGKLGRIGAFPNAAAVRSAFTEYRQATTALMRLDSALDSAMLADQARAAARADVAAQVADAAQDS